MNGMTSVRKETLYGSLGSQQHKRVPSGANQAFRACSAPRVSVIVPCYNYGRWLRACIESALKQNNVAVDVLIVNDASTDDSKEVADELAREDSRVSVIHHATNMGHIPSVNEALRAINGDYIVKLDADDLLAPGSLSRSVALLESHPNVGFVYGRCLYFGADLKSTMPRSARLFRAESLLFTDSPSERALAGRVRRWTIWPGHTWLALRCQRGVNCISQPEAVMRSSAVREIGSYDERLPHTSDLAMWLGLAKRSDVGYVDGPIQGLYRVHKGSMQRTVNAGKMRDLTGRLAAFESVLRDMDAVPQAEEFLDTARARLASEALEAACRAFDRGRTGTEPVTEYVDFALRAYPASAGLPEWERLLRRQRISTRFGRFHPTFIVDAMRRRAREEASHMRWWRTGV